MATSLDSKIFSASVIAVVPLLTKTELLLLKIPFQFSEKLLNFFNYAYKLFKICNSSRLSYLHKIKNQK